MMKLLGLFVIITISCLVGCDNAGLKGGQKFKARHIEYAPGVTPYYANGSYFDVEVSDNWVIVTLPRGQKKLVPTDKVLFIDITPQKNAEAMDTTALPERK